MADEKQDEGVVVARLPYGAEFTPTALGKVLGPDAVLQWLLQTASGKTIEDFLTHVVTKCFGHIKGQLESKRTMASHVLVSMKAYKLVADIEPLALTPAGAAILAAPATDTDAIFARHILAHCGGQRFVDAIRRYELRGETPDMESLSIEFGENATSKNLSAMRAWLGRAGVLSTTGPYRVIETGLEAVLGAGAGKLYGLDDEELEFLIAARIIEAQTGKTDLDAKIVADLAQSRHPELRIRRKALGNFVKGLEEAGLVKLLPQVSGPGGSRTAFELIERASKLTDEQLRDLLEQSKYGISLAELRPLAEVVNALDSGTAHSIGRYGEMLAVHLCLLLRLSVVSWRKRAPHSEIDLIAERLIALTYQRWVVQVKNKDGDLNNEEVDREIGATTGIGVTHILFVVPRGELSGPALREIRTRSRLTGLHMYYLTRSHVEKHTTEALLTHLRARARVHEADKRAEATRREGT